MAPLLGCPSALLARDVLDEGAQPPVTPAQIKAALTAAFYAAVLCTCGYLVWNYNRLKAAAAKVPELENKVRVLASGYESLSNEVIRRAEFDAALRDRRATINTEVEKAADEDPAVADYLHERIPAGVREAHRRGSQK
jgi:hypothetical protein